MQLQVRHSRHRRWRLHARKRCVVVASTNGGTPFWLKSAAVPSAPQPRLSRCFAVLPTPLTTSSFATTFPVHLSLTTAYLESQVAIDKAYGDEINWTKRSVANTACNYNLLTPVSGKFSSDRTIHEYAKDIWNIQVCDREVWVFLNKRACRDQVPSPLTLPRSKRQWETQ